MAHTTVLIAGDWAPIRAFGPLIRTSPESVYGDLLPDLRTADLRIVNCECALTSASTQVWKSGSVFKGEPRDVVGLTSVPFDVACLANNHVLDYGVKGLDDTLRALDREGVLSVGAGLSGDQVFAPLTISVNRTKIHVVNFSEGEDLTASNGGPGVFGWELGRVADIVSRCRAKGGIVIAIGHCGLEYVPYPPPYVVAAFRQIADAGAHVVVGHHAHVPQGLEWHNGVPIIYSLGNFVFFQETSLRARKTGFCVRVTLDGEKLTAVRLHPYRITDDGLRKLGTKESGDFRRTMARLSKPFESEDGSDAAWRAYLAYYGVGGFRNEVAGIVERFETEPQKAAAMFRNRITTMQHRELWQDFLTQVMEGKGPRYPRDAARMVEEYFTRKVDSPEVR